MTQGVQPDRSKLKELLLILWSVFYRLFRNRKYKE